MTLEKMRRELAPMGMKGGGDEHKGFGAIADIFSSDD
jgi:hypothetical protein